MKVGKKKEREKEVKDEHFSLAFFSRYERFMYTVQVQINDENCEVMRSTAREEERSDEAMKYTFN